MMFTPNRPCEIESIVTAIRAAIGGGMVSTAQVANSLMRDVVAARPAYCAGLSEQAPPKWPDCTYGPLGGALDRSTTIDYRWK